MRVENFLIYDPNSGNRIISVWEAITQILVQLKNFQFFSPFHFQKFTPKFHKVKQNCWGQNKYLLNENQSCPEIKYSYYVTMVSTHRVNSVQLSVENQVENKYRYLPTSIASARGRTQLYRGLLWQNSGTLTVAS